MQRSIDCLTQRPFDIAVIGGGVHGAWIALRAAQAGHRVALIERGDFGAATSANSLRVLHGGLRYLQYLDLRRMRSSIRARRALMQIAPHLVRPVPFVMPLQAQGVRSPWLMGPALLANDAIAIDRNRGMDAGARIPMGRLLSGGRTARHARPLVDIAPLAGAQWWEAVADDTHRLVLEPILEAVNLGAEVANKVSAVGYLVNAGRVVGVIAEDLLTGRHFEIRAAVTVNATGPAAAELSVRSDLPIGFMPRWVGALNLVLRREITAQVAVALSSASRQSDGSAVLRRATRELFFVPWRDVTMVGTDYYPVAAGQHPGNTLPPADAVQAFVAEIDAVAPNAAITTHDVLRIHWGVLPCDERATDVPRKSPLLVHDAAVLGVTGLAVVIGEKLTSAPVVAERIISAISAGGRLPVKRGQSAPEVAPASPVVNEGVKNRLQARYGSRRWRAALSVANGHPELLLPVLQDCAILTVEVLYAVRAEMAGDLPSVLRRVGLADGGHPGRELVARIAAIAGPELGWSDVDTRDEIKRIDALMTVR